MTDQPSEGPIFEAARETGPEPQKAPPAEGNMADTPPERTRKSKRQYQIDIFRDWCKNCGICSAFCPKGCIQLNEDGAPVISEDAQCSGCGWCEVHCPDFAVSVRELRTKKLRTVDEACE